MVKQKIWGAYILENGYVLILMPNGDLSDGDQVYDGKLFDYEFGEADIDQDGDMWRFKEYEDDERSNEIRELVRETIADKRVEELPSILSAFTIGVAVVGVGYILFETIKFLYK